MIHANLSARRTLGFINDSIVCPSVWELLWETFIAVWPAPHINTALGLDNSGRLLRRTRPCGRRLANSTIHCKIKPSFMINLLVILLGSWPYWQHIVSWISRAKTRDPWDNFHFNTTRTRQHHLSITTINGSLGPSKCLIAQKRRQRWIHDHRSRICCFTGISFNINQTHLNLCWLKFAGYHTKHVGDILD